MTVRYQLPVPPDPGQIQRLIQTAKGDQPADLVVRNARLLNVYTGRIEQKICLAAVGEWIVHVGEFAETLVGPETTEIDAAGRYLLPGYIDAHTHLDSIFTCAQYSVHALAAGNTTAVTECAMIAGAAGANGLRAYVEEARAAPMRVFLLAPPLTPVFPEFESAAELPREVFGDLLMAEDCLGVGETYWTRPVNKLDERAIRNFALARKLGKTIEGHAAGARNQKLMAYLAGGVTSCHEAITAEEGLERLRLGLGVMIREGFVRREMEAVLPPLLDYDTTNIMLVSDLAPPDELVAEGVMRTHLIKAVAQGADPVQAVRMVTLNPARYYGLHRIMGGLGPGKVCDAVLVNDLKEFEADQVILGGRVVAEGGRVTFEVTEPVFEAELYRTMKFPAVAATDFEIAADGPTTVRVAEVAGPTITREIQETLTPIHGNLAPDFSRDLLKMAVINKHSADLAMSIGFVRGVGFEQGAVATSLIWDTNNVLVVGASEADMAVAANRVKEAGGGIVVVAEGRVRAEFFMPMGGVISTLPLPEINRQAAAVRLAMAELGSKLERPWLTFQTLAFTGLPFLRITDKGLADVRRGELVPLIV
ncbi:MAG: amidohydrolase family protein [Proteobacteria bacterium]|nr:amidohydrolase family protein [Pseudomonadota bacterium]MBU1741884.1 amidohydrolase family protein [Pseudomonadota bacterium]